MVRFAKARDLRPVVLGRSLVVAFLLAALGSQWFALGYRDPGNEDPPCTPVRKTGCHAGALLAITAKGKWLSTPGQDSDPNNRSDANTSDNARNTTIDDDALAEEHGTKINKGAGADEHQKTRSFGARVESEIEEDAKELYKELKEEGDEIMHGEFLLYDGIFSGDFKKMKWSVLLCSSLVMLMLFVAIVGCIKFTMRCLFGHVAAKQSLPVDAGHILTCIQDAIIYENVTSREVIGKVTEGAEVLVHGRPQEHDGIIMLPIQPQGAVKLELFVTSQMLNIMNGTVLVCIADEKHPADIWHSMTASTVLDVKIQRGEKVIAAGKPEWVEGYMMLPIRPHGAVEAGLFEIPAQDDEDHGAAMIQHSVSGAFSRVSGDTAEEAGQEVDEPEEAAPEDEEEKLTPEMVEVKERMNQLKKEKTRLMFEQASRKEKLATILRDMSTAEAELKGLQEADLTPEESLRKAEEAMRSMDAMTEKGVLSAVAYATPIMQHSKKIYSKFEERLHQTQKRVQKLAFQETKNLVLDVQSVLGVGDLGEMDNTLLDNINTPSLAAIVASALAPAQLRLLHIFNFLAMVLSLTWMMADVAVVAWDWQEPCMNKPTQINEGMELKTVFEVWWKNASSSGIYCWFLVDFCVHTMCAFIRWRVVVSVGAVMEVIETPPPLQVVDHPLDALRLMFDFYLSTGAEALFQLDEVMASSVLYFASWSVCFDTCWLIYSVDIVWNTPWSMCDSIGLSILRIRSLLFLMLFLVYTIQVVGFVISQLFASSKFAMTCINVADKIDEVLELGIPVAKVLVHALVVRNSSDMLVIQLNMHQLERDQLQMRREYLQRELGEVDECDEKTTTEIERLNAERMGMSDQWKDKSQKQAEFLLMKQNIMKDSSKFIDEIKKKTAKASEEAATALEEIEKNSGDETAGLATDDLEPGADLVASTSAGVADSDSTMGGLVQRLQSDLQAEQDTSTSSSALPAGTAAGAIAAAGLFPAAAVGVDAGLAQMTLQNVLQTSPDLAAGPGADLAAGGPRASRDHGQAAQADDAAGARQALPEEPQNNEE